MAKKKKLQLKLNWIEVKNFRGANFKAEFSGENGTISGKNGSGKTTIADAYYFLFDDQDSSGTSRFSILELDKDGSTIDRQAATIEAEFWVGSKLMKLKKIHRQKWTKKGQQTGETTEYYFDDMELNVTKTEYYKRLSAILPLKNIRSLIDVNHFCGRLKPDIRRRALLELIGNISDKEVLKHFDDKELSKALNERDSTTTKKYLSMRITQLEKDIVSLIERNRGAMESMPSIDGLDEEKLKKDIERIDEEISKNREKIYSISIDSSIADFKKEIIEIDSKIMELRNENVSSVQASIAEDKRKLYQTNIDIDEKKALLDSFIRSRDDLRKKWWEVDSRRFVRDDVCFACGQTLPQDMITKQESVFNDKKANDKKEIDIKGKKFTDKINVFEREVERLREIAKSTEIAISIEQNKIDSFKVDERLIERKRELKQEIEKSDRNIYPQIQNLKKAIADLDDEKEQIKSKLLNFTHIDKINSRTKQRDNDLLRKREEKETYEKLLIKLDDFELKKAEILERRVNERFDIVKWKLFKHQFNEEIRQICEATYIGISYGVDLNTGARINVGFDCIKTLQNHYDVNIPVFIDNAESVTDWLVESDIQIIKLIARENIDNLEASINGD